MNEYIEFFSQHWMLSSLFVGLIVAYVLFEVFEGDNSSDHISPEKAVGLFNHKQAVIIDIRKPEHYQAGHIIGSMLTDPSNLELVSRKLQKYAKKTIIVTDSNGRDAGKFMKNLKSKGFAHVLHIAGGIQGWQSAGLPLTNKD